MKLKEWVAVVVFSALVFAVAYVFMTLRMEACPLFTTCIQVR